MFPTVLLCWLALPGLAQESPSPVALPEIPEEDEPDAPSEAVADPEPADETEVPAAPPSAAAATGPAPLEANRAPPPGKPQRTYELAMRSRYVSIPKGILDSFLINAGDREWPLGSEQRPAVLGYSIGLEFSVVQKENTLLGFYVEYLGSLMQEGYWDDIDSPPDGRDGDYLRPNPGFGAIVLAFNAFHDATIVDEGQTGGKLKLSFYVGGGLGIAGIVGSVDQWELDTVNGTPAYVSARNGDEPDKKLSLGSPVWPMVDFEMGLRFLIAEHVVLRLGGGIHDGLQVGGNLGARF